MASLMRLSDWRAKAPSRDAMTGKVLALLQPVLAAVGAEPDPGCWIAWGDDPSSRYLVLVPTAPGLISCNVRVNVPGEGPRAAAKLVRWNRVQIGELAVESQGGHRLVSVPVEGQVLRGVDAEADRVSAFVLALFAAIDGRVSGSTARTSRRSAPARTSPRSTAKRKAAEPRTGRSRSRALVPVPERPPGT